MKIVKLKAITKRAKDRIATHGDEFEVLEVKTNARKPNEILLRSMDTRWLGWMEIGVEAEIVNEKVL
jgi:hypothetical protein